MAINNNNSLTVFQRLNRMFSNYTSSGLYGTNTNSLTTATTNDNDIILKTNDKVEYDKAFLQAKQQYLLARQWKKAEFDIHNKTLANLTAIKMMYRDADLMDDFPEIGAAIDITTEESTYINDKGFMLNISSKSERVRKILMDLFYNRLQVNVNVPMIARAMIKYGNDFMLLNIDANDGVIGWKQLPVYEIERFENGAANPYTSPYSSLSQINPNMPSETQFIWVGQNEFIPYKHWQIAHFRLLYDSKFLPYGVSFLQKARRHFRMLSMMEDMMLIYRLERSWERRVYKINVGGIDPEDVPALVEQVANNFKRTPIIDPETGQIDLRKNIMSMTEDYFVPVREPGEPSPIETLQGAQNLTAMDDIKFIQNKVLAALRVPLSFISFDSEKAEGKNLSLLDIRFTKTVNRIQQYLIMELNKIAIIHLKLLGLDDELTNFSLTMNNPSSQSQMLEIENLGKKIQTAKDAVGDTGNGIPLYSNTRAWKEIFGWSDKEIKDNLEEIRLEKALSGELKLTNQIIKRTRLFDPIDNIYGEPGADYSYQGEDGEGGGDPMSLGGGGGFSGLDFGGDDMSGVGGEMDMGDAAMENAPDMSMGDGNEMLSETILNGLEKRNNKRKQDLIESLNKRQEHYRDKLYKHINEISSEEKNVENIDEIPMMSKNLFINEEMTHLCEQLNDCINKKDYDKPKPTKLHD